MEKVVHTPPVFPVQPMPVAPAPVVQAPIMQPPMPVVEKPVHNDIHLHASYQQTSIVYPTPKPAMVVPAVVKPYSNAGSILVLFILLVIISRGYKKC